MAGLRIEDYIQQLQDPGPEFRDPEDLDDDTDARLAPHAAEDDSTAPSLQPSSLRRRASAFIGVGGKKINRKELFHDFAFSDDESEPQADLEEEEMDKEEEEDDDDDDSDNTGEEEKMSDEESEEDEENSEKGDDRVKSFDRVKTSSLSSPSPPYAPSSPSDSEIEEDEMQMSDDEEERVKENGDHDLQSDDDDDDDELENEEDETEEGGAEDENEDIVIQETAIDEREKAQAVVQQLDLWDRLMEARIQLQKLVSLANRLTATSSQLQDSPQLSEACNALLEMNCTLHNVHNSPSSPRKRPADVDIDELAFESYQSLATARNSTLTFWDEKTRLASKKFKSFKSYQTPVVKQVEQILSDRDRLLRRTQVIRDADAPDVCEKPEEVFDDNDFYQRLLKNLIESKASEQSTMSVSASQWLEVQRLRGKKKKKDVDTRASKGRKLRYNVHSKMVNFMAPSDRSSWSEDARNDLFKNLFKMPSHSE